MKRFSKWISVLAIALSLLLVLCACRNPEVPEVPEQHTYGEWIFTVEPTETAPGSRYRVCADCQKTETESVPAHAHACDNWTVTAEPTYTAAGERRGICSVCGYSLVEAVPVLTPAYVITIVDDGVQTKLPLASDGVYSISAPAEKIGYEFVGYFDGEDKEFSLTGTVSANVTVYAKYDILETNTFAQLKERMEAGADIVISGDITLENTVYVSDTISITSSGSYTLKRASGFLGDLFVVGTYSDGKNPLYDGRMPSVTVKPGDNFTITFDGNKSEVTGDVSGTLFLLKNSAKLNTYDGVIIQNFKKTSNEYFLADDHNISSPALIGGSAVIIANGAFNMYGGEILNCEVNTNDATGSNDSSRGGAIFNHGTFNMQGGIIDGCRAARGGAIYNYRVSYLTAGEIKNNHATAYGGVFYNPDSQYVYAVIGDKGETVKMNITNNTCDKSGGAIYTAHQATVYVMGATLFKQNSALGGNGGVINAAGAVVIDYAVFEKNTASSKGGAIYAYYNAPGNTIRIVEIKSGKFTENEAPRGGAIGLNCGDDVSGIGAKLELGGVEFNGNRAPLTSGGKYGYGAAMHIDQGSCAYIYGSAKFIGNESGGNGGAVYITKASNLQISATENVSILMKDNVSADNGGAIYNSGSTVVMHANGGSILLDTNSSANGKGGAIAVHSSGTVKLYGIEAKNNKAENGNGGALYVYGGHAVIGDDTVKASSVFKNNVAEKGGAIYLAATDSADASLYCYDLSCDSNTATSGGGAVYALATADHSATLSANSMTLTNNKADDKGGAMYIYTNATVNITNLTVTGNKAESGDGYGGAAYISGKAKVYINNISASDNRAISGGCIYLTTGATTLTISKGTMSANAAASASKGNAVWVNAASSVLKLEVNAEDEYLLAFTEGDILGKTGFEITKYKEDAQQ